MNPKNKIALVYASWALWLACLPTLGQTQDTSADQEPPTLNGLLKRSSKELDRLYAGSPRGEIPDGFGRGKAIVAPGTILTPPIAFLAGLWRGKVFDAKNGMLYNRGPLGVKIAPAKVYYGESWYDPNPAIIIDYQETAFAWVRDEIRPVAQGIYLGRAYNSVTHSLILYFALDFNSKNAETGTEPAVQLLSPWPDHNP